MFDYLAHKVTTRCWPFGETTGPIDWGFRPQQSGRKKMRKVRAKKDGLTPPAKATASVDANEWH